MAFSRPRTTLKRDYFIVDFDVPSADSAAFFIELRGASLRVRGRYTADVRRERFSFYPQSGGRIDGAYTLPVPVTDNPRYIDASYDGEVLKFVFRRADEFSERRVEIVV